MVSMSARARHGGGVGCVGGPVAAAAAAAFVRPAWSVLCVLVLVLCLGVPSSGVVIQNLTVYSDAACSTPWTNGSASSTWPAFSTLSSSQVDSSLLGTPGDCLGAISPTVQSARVACVTSRTSLNVTLYTLSAVEWSHNSTCPTDYRFDIRYYFYGFNGSCISGQVTSGGVTQQLYARFSCASTDEQPSQPGKRNGAEPASAAHRLGALTLLTAAATALLAAITL